MTKLVRFDWAIKYLLRNKANFDILEGFLSELLKTSIHIESILESESNKEKVDDKFNRVDLLAKTAEGHYVIIEVQCSGQWDYLSRILYGTSKAVCEYMREGDAYKTIRKVISVSIVFFNLGQGKDYLYKGSTTFEGLHYHDILNLNAQERQAYTQSGGLQLETPEQLFPEYYIIKVIAFQEKVKDKLDEWIYFLKHSKIEKQFTAQGIQTAAEKLDVLRLNEKERRVYAKYQEGLHDDASFMDMLTISEKIGLEKGLEQGLEKGLEQGLQKGLEQGLAKGHQKGDLEARHVFARKLLAKNFPLDEIVALTELTLADIQALKE